MRYNKPDGISYAKMCMYIDSDFNCDTHRFEHEDTVFQYLYVLYHMFANKYMWFNNDSDLDNYSVHSAETAMLRMEDPNQSKVVSCLRWIKCTAYAYMCQYMRSEYTYESKSFDDICAEDASLALHRKLQDDCAYAMSKVEFGTYLRDIASSVKKYVYDATVNMDNVVRDRVYISCLLTTLNCFTLPKRSINHILKCGWGKNIHNVHKVVERMYVNNQDNPVILYNLDKNMHDYILVLSREIKNVLAQDLASILHSPSLVYMGGANILTSEVMYDSKAKT